jgi:hypothetical protein
MNSKKRLLIDLALFVALLVANNPAWTGIAVHEWLSIAIVIPLGLHLVINWEWTVAVSRRLIDRMLHMSAVNLIVDAALFVSAVTVLLSGLMVSQVASGAIGLAITPSAIWVATHAVSATATIALLFTHFALHWRWVARVLGQLTLTRQETSR